MTKGEFLQAFGEKLSEGLPTNEVLRQMQYYEGFFDAETSRGRTEAEVLSELGNPVLLARNVLESPVSSRSYQNTLSPYEQGFAEGSYAGKNQSRDPASGSTEDTSPRSQGSRYAQPKAQAHAAYSAPYEPRTKNQPVDRWRKEPEPEDLQKKGSWQKMPDPEEQPEPVRGSVEGTGKPGLVPTLAPILLGIVLLSFIIIGCVTGGITKSAMILPIILLAVALVIVFILVIIRKKRK